MTMWKVGQNIKGSFDSIQTAVCILDKDLNIIFVNSTFEDFFGYTLEKLINRSAPLFLQRSFKKLFDDPLIVSNHIKFCYQNKNVSSNFECHLKPSKKRQERWLEYKNQLIKTGLFYGGFIEQYVDITNLKKTQQFLFQSELKYINLVENSAVGIGVFRNNKIIYANPALLNLFGYSLSDLQTKSLLDYVYKEDKEKVLNKMKLLAEGKTMYPYSFEHRIVDSQNKVKTLSLQISEFYINKERFSQATFVDVTETKVCEFKEKQLAIEAIQLEHRMKILHEVEEQIMRIINQNNYNKNTFNSLFDLLKNEFVLEKRWNFFKRRIDRIYPEFFRTLVDKHPALTQKDLKHCALIKMGFDTKDIAAILNVKPSSIQIARVRLKKKLDLKPKQILKNYILQM